MTVADTKGLEDLREIIESYNTLAERLTESQGALQAEVLELRKELSEKNRQLARKNRLAVLGEMAAGVAHEIRNPLGGIELYAGLIRRESADSPKVTRWAERIHQATSDLSHIVGDILDFTRPVKPRFTNVSLLKIAEASVEMASGALEAAEVQVRFDAEGERLIAADSGLLQRALLNIVLNAAEATKGGGRLWVRVVEDELGGLPARTVSFRDTGCGIPEADLAKVFDPFFSCKSGGTGLGLAMVARIVEAHHGIINAVNHPDGGAVFSITLPAESASEENE